jgi:Protein of unknown function (DUF2905)
LPEGRANFALVPCAVRQYQIQPPFFLVGAAMSRTLIVVGLIIVAVGLLWPWLSRIGLGRLPGDIVIERENFTFYAPIVTGVLISIVLSIILWLVNR